MDKTPDTTKNLELNLKKKVTKNVKSPYTGLLHDFYEDFKDSPYNDFKIHCDQLLKQIRSGQRPEFFKAIHGVLTPIASVKKMISYLIHTNKPIYQIMGIELIQKIQDPYFIPHIVPFIYSSHKPLQQIAIRTVIQLEGNAESILEQSLSDRSEWKRNIALKVLHKINPDNPKLLYLELASEDHIAVIKAIQKLTESEDRKVIAKIKPLLSHRDISIRAAAIEGIGKLGGKNAHQILENHLTAENFSILREKIFQYI